jgi:quinol monooxygenase YgiN
MAVAVLAFFNPKPGSEAALESLLRGMVAPSRAEPSCLQYDLHHEAGEGRRLVIHETYKDAEGVAAHRACSHYLEYRRQVESLIDGPIAVTVLDPLDVAAK